MKIMGKFGVYEYSPGHWQVYFSHEGKQIHIQRKHWCDEPLRTKEDCLQVIQFLQEYGYDPERWGKDTSFRFDQAIQVWIKTSHVSPEWQQQRKQISKRFLLPYFGKQDIRNIKTLHIQQFYSKLLEKDYKAKYLKNVLGELRAFFHFFKKSLKDIPDFPQISVQVSAVRWLTEEEQEKVYAKIPQTDMSIFQFMRSYGCRINEASGLLKENVFLDHDPPYVVLSTVLGTHGNIKPTTKTKRARILPIIPEIRWIFLNSEDSTFVFTKNARPYSNKILSGVWKRATKEAGIEINLYNGVRHSFGCQRLNSGYGLDEIKAIMGHTNVKTTERYAQYELKSLEDIIRGKRVYNLFIPESGVKLLENKGKESPSEKAADLFTHASAF